MKVIREPLWDAIDRYSLAMNPRSKNAAADEVEAVVATAIRKACAITAAHATEALATTKEQS